ncbi:MAG: pyocin activator PrtN family protein [Rhodoferax sp.]|nr:pyocin activator PrtN family protein [Rhodoferax sp.]
MKTELMLLIQTDGRPTMTVADMSRLLNLTPRSVQNRIYKKDLPFPVFKLADSGEWVAHVSDVALHIDTQREEAAKMMQ